MAAVNPCLYLPVDLFYDAKHMALPWGDVIGQGIVGATDLAVSQHGAGTMSVDVAAGAAWITGDDSPTVQGSYRVYNDGTVNLVIGANASGNPRIDLVIAEVLDSTWAGASNLWRLRAVAGTPGAVPVAPACPVDAIPLATVAVANGASQILTANITGTGVLASIGGGKIDAHGWTNSPEPWVYVGIYSFKIVGVDATARYPIGTKLSYTDVTTKFSYVAGAAYTGGDTTVTLIVGSAHLLSGGAITNPRYSYADTPQGFPAAFLYTAGIGGFAATPAQSCYFAVNGRQETVWFYCTGTSAAGATSITIPQQVSALFPSSAIPWIIRVTDNSGAAVLGSVSVMASSAALTLFRDVAGSAFTTSGGKQVQGCVTVPI